MIQIYQFLNDSPECRGGGAQTNIIRYVGMYAAPNSGIFERGDSPLAVIYSITNFLFSNEIT